MGSGVDIVQPAVILQVNSIGAQSVSKTRVYIVTDAENQKTLVRAVSASQAIRHIVSTEYRARVAKVDDIIAIGTDEVEDATKDHSHE